MFAAAGAAVLAAAAMAAIQPGAPPTAPVERSAGALPLAFVANAGQSDARVRYEARAAGFDAFFTDRGVTLVLAKGSRRVALELGFVGANPRPRIAAGARAAGTVNHIGAGASHAGLATFGELTYEQVWPGIDLVLRGEPGSLKYEFHVAPGADPGDIALAYRGAEGLSVAASGALAVKTALGTLTDARPVSHQGPTRVASRYRVDGMRYGFALPAGYDRSRPLVIDPGIAYSTFLGSTGSDSIQDVAVNAEGSAYVVGGTASTGFPATPGTYDISHNGGGYDVFVSKLTPDGSGLLYSTFIGGASHDEAFSIAVDGDGSAYVTGRTDSLDFPTTPGAYDRSFNGVGDVFAAKLSPDGASLAYSTFIGGSSEERGFGIAVDGNGSAYLTGFTISEDFPAVGGFDASVSGAEGFVAKLSPAGAALEYATLLGGMFDDGLWAIAVDDQGSAYVTGFSASPDFPATADAFDRLYGDGYDAIVAKLTPSGGALAYATFLGGPLDDEGYGIAVDRQGAAYVTGLTMSSNFPTTPGAHDRTHTGDLNHEAFVTKLAPSGAGLAYSTLLGDVGFDEGRGIAVDGAGFAYVTGRTASAGFPTTADAHDRALDGAADAFVTKLGLTGGLAHSTFFGGVSSDEVRAIAVDRFGNAFVAGGVSGPDFPTTAGAYDRSWGGLEDGFVAKLQLDDGPALPSGVQERTLQAEAPTVLSLQLGQPGTLGPIIAGVARDYETTMAATVTVSTDGALLTVADPSPTAPGRLVNGTAALASRVRARADSEDGAGGPFADVGGAASPTTLVTYPDQASNDMVTLTFQQRVGARDKVRAGLYAKTLTFTLGAVAP